MKENKRQLVLKYIRLRYRMFVTYLFVSMMYFFIYILYHLPISYALYAFEITSFLGFFIVIIDFITVVKKHNELCKFIHAVEINNIKQISTDGMIEEDYQNLFLALKEQLQNDIQKLEEKEKNQVDYLTMWTHQIKTPVAAMRLVLSNMQAGQEKSNLETELFRVEEYINMVLQYIRIDSMYSDLVLKQYNLYSIVRQVVKKYSIVFIHKHISLDMKPFEQMITTDEKWVTFVIEQILSNALKYTNQGCIRIYQESDKVLVIEDTGIGIRPEDISRVFERGYTGYNGRVDKKSTGIGMYLCKTILDHLGHTIYIESTVGKGTKVEINFNEYKIDVRD